MSERMKRGDITDEQVVQACADYRDGLTLTPPGSALVANGAPRKVVEAAMYRAVRRGLINYGVSVWTAWPEEEGRRLLRESE